MFHRRPRASFYRGGYYAGVFAGFGAFAAYPFYGWYDPEYYTDEYENPWYYYEPSFNTYEAAPAAPTESGAVPADVQGAGEWVEVPGQSVNGTWVPPHRVWIPADQEHQD